MFLAAIAAGQGGDGFAQLAPDTLWNAAQASDEPWSADRGTMPETADSNVRQADFRATLPGTEFNRTAPNATPDAGRGQDLTFDIPTGEPENRGQWHQSLGAALRQEAGSINWVRMLGSLAIVVSGWLILMALLRRLSGGRSGRLPATVFELVGSARLNHRQSLQLVRVGSRLLVLMVSPEGAHPVGEISQPAEVESLLAGCQSRRRQTRAEPAPATSFVPVAPVGQREPVAIEPILRALQQSLAGQGASREFVA